MQWQPGADIKGVTTVYPDIIPQYIPFDYDKLASVQSAKAKEKAKKAASTSMTPLWQMLKDLRDFDMPTELPVMVDPNTGETINEKNHLGEKAKTALERKLFEYVSLIEEEPSMLMRAAADLSVDFGKLSSLAKSIKTAKGLYEGYKGSNPSGKLDLLTNFNTYLSGDDPYAFGTAGVSETFDTDGYLRNGFESLKADQDSDIGAYRSSIINGGMDVAYYATENSKEYIGRQKTEAAFNGFWQNADVQRQITKDIKFRIDNLERMYNRLPKASKEQYSNKLSDTEYIARKKEIIDAFAEADRLEKAGNKTSTPEALRREAREKQDMLFSQKLENAPLIVDSKGNIRRDLMEDNLRLINQSNKYGEFVGSGMYEFGKDKINMVGNRYLSDYLKSQKEDKEKTGANRIVGQSFTLNPEAVNFKSVSKGLGKAVDESDYGSLNAQMTMTKAYFANIIKNPIVKQDLDRIINTLNIAPNAIDNKKLQALLRNKPEVLSLVLSAALAYKESGSWLTSGIDSKNWFGTPATLKQVVEDNLPEGAKVFTKELIDAFMGTGVFNKKWSKEDIGTFGTVGKIVAGQQYAPLGTLPSGGDNQFYKFIEQAFKDGLAIPGAYEFTNMYSGKDSEIGQFLEGQATLNTSHGEKLKTFVIVNGDLHARIEKGTEKEPVTEYRLLTNGKYGTTQYNNLLDGIVKATLDNDDPTTQETAAYLAALRKFSTMGVDKKMLDNLFEVYNQNGNADLLSKDSKDKLNVAFKNDKDGNKYMTVTVNGKSQNIGVLNYQNALGTLGLLF